MEHSKIQFTWSHLVADQNFSKGGLKYLVLWILVWGTLSGFAIADHDWLTLVAVVPLLAAPLPLCLPWRSRIDLVDNRIRLRNQPILTSPLLWMPAMFMVATVGTGAHLGAGVLNGWRLAIPAIGLPIVSVYLLRTAYRLRGPIFITPDGLLTPQGDFEFATTKISQITPARAVPTIQLRLPSAPDREVSRIMPKLLNVDYNTFASVIFQLQAWASEGRETTTLQEIEAMLTVLSPENVPLGESVVLTVPVLSAVPE